MTTLRQRLQRFAYDVRSYSWVKDWHRLRRGVEEGAIDRPIFLVGMQGGGLTLLSRMLRRHPDVVGACGDSRYWTSADEMQNTYGLVLPAELSGTRFKAPPHPRLTPPRSWTYATDELLPAYRGRAAQATPEIKQRFESVLRYAITRFGRGRAVRFVDKSQSFTVRAGLIGAVLREHRPLFVLVPRDPYVSVARAATGKAGDMRRLAGQLSYDERVRYCAEHFVNSIHALWEDQREAGFPLLVVQFERLLEQPERELRRVCEFVGLSFDADMLPSPSHRLPFASRYQDRWYPIKSGINRAYDRTLDARVVAAINARGRDVVEQLGYPVREGGA